MKKALLVMTLLLMALTGLIAQKDSLTEMRLRYKIELTTADKNVLQGWFVNSRNSSLLVYTGTQRDWKNNAQYNLVQFDYNNIQLVKLKKRNSGAKGMLIGAGIGAAIFASSFLIPEKGCGCKQVGPEVFAFFGIPVGMIAGSIIGAIHKKKFRINSSKSNFNAFKNIIK